MAGKKLIIIIIALIAVIGGASALYGRLGGQAETSQLAAAQASGQRAAAPDFTVYDGEGSKVKLSDFRGRPVVLNFWASWCGPCRMEMPEFDREAKLRGSKVQFLMVNMTGEGETVEKASAFVRKNGYSFPVFYDRDMDAASAYGIQALPTTYFIRADGTIAARAEGAIDTKVLQRGISMITEDGK